MAWKSWACFTFQENSRMAFWDRFELGFSLLRFDYFDWKTDFRRGVLQYIPARLKWQLSRSISEITLSVDLSIWTIFSEPQSALIRANAEYFRFRSKCKILGSSGVTRKTRFKRANKMCSSHAVARVAPVSDKKHRALPCMFVFYLEALLPSQHENHSR